MTVDRWREIEALFHAAQDSPADRRAELLGNADPAVRREVESLLARCDREGPLDFATDLLKEIGSAGPTDEASVRLEPGMTLGSYVVLSTLGRGGMGEVYRARDTKLDRDVAIKVLPAAMAPDDTRAARFRREAKTLAALNHPNIAAIYGLEEGDGTTALVLELVEGPTLADRIIQGPLTLDDTLRIATQIAEALEAAHERGIVHRDLKPSNIKLRPDGTVKVLDFGLATRPGRMDVSDSTVDGGPSSRGMTRYGVILGTVGYMSPEQAAGTPADLASDQFSFGVILFELLTGLRPFERASTADTLFAIMRDDPPSVRTLNSTVPVELQHVIGRCLAKLPRERFTDSRELAARLRHIREQMLTNDAATPSAMSMTRGPRRPTRRRVLWVAGSVLATLAAVVAGRPWSADRGIRSLAVLPFVNIAQDPDIEYLCDGITESLIQRISRLPSLTVMARSTVFNFKDQTIDAREAGRRLGVNAILTGTVARQSGRLRITAELVEVASGARLWGGTFDRGADAVVSIQDEISNAIVDEGIRVRLSGDERRALISHPTDDAEAYELYLRARHAVFRTTEEDTLQARELLQRAIERDPRFTAAYSALAATYLAAAIDGFERPVEAIPEARRLLRQLRDIDPQFPDAHGPAATIAFFFDWDWTAAEREWEALDRLPSGVLPIQERVGFSLARWALAGPGEALPVVRRLREADPLTPSYAVLEADYLFHSGLLDSAAALYDIVLRDGAIPDALFGLAEVRVAQRRFDEAIEVRRRAHRAVGDDTVADMVITARGKDGYRQIEIAAARNELERLREHQKIGYVSPLDVARAHAVLGERDQVFSAFADAFDDRAPGLVFLKVDRAWDNVRDDPRFADAIRRVRFP